MTDFLSAHAFVISLACSIFCWLGIFMYLWKMDTSLTKLEQYMNKKD